MPDFPEIGYGTVRGRFLAGVLDSDDAAAFPDAEPLSGHVTFAATAPVVRVVSAMPAPASLFPQSLRVYLDEEGYLSRDGSRDISLWATDDADGNPVDWQWRVAFSLNHEGRDVYHAPFNFVLATGATVDLTVVAPLITPSPGTIIIQGPPGESASDVIDATGDLIVGGPAGDAVRLPVGADDTVLTADSGLPEGMGWKPIDAGLKVYPDRTAVDAVHVAEVGVWHVPNVTAEFAHLVASHPNGEFSGTGPADFVVETSVTDGPLNSGVYLTRVNIVQTIWVSPVSASYAPVLLQRNATFDTATDAFISVWSAWDKRFIPLPKPLVVDQALVTQGSPPQWTQIYASTETFNNSFVIRDGQGRAKVWAPDHNGQAVLPEHVANVDWVGRQIAAIPPAGAGGLKVYANLAEMLAERTANVGTLHVDDVPTAFPYLASQNPGGAWATPGPAELVVQTQLSPVYGSPGQYAVLQTMVIGDAGSKTQWPANRMFWWMAGDAESTIQFEAAPPLMPRALAGTVPYSPINGTWSTRQAKATPDPNTIVTRDSAGRAQIVDPAVAADIASKGYVDGKVAAVPIPPGAPDATSSVKGILRLTGDLAGTADAPTVPALADKVSLSSFGAKGDLLAGGGLFFAGTLPVGPNGQVLTADSAQSFGVKWAPAASGGIPPTLVDAKGDLIVGSANDAVSRLPVGTDGQVLTADAASPLGMKYTTPAAGGATGAMVMSPKSGHTLWPAPGALNGWVVGTNPFVSGSGSRGTPLIVAHDTTVNALICRVGTAQAGCFVKVLLYASDAWGYPRTLVAQTPPIDCTTAALKTVTLGASVPITAGLYFGFLITDTGSAVRFYARNFREAYQQIRVDAGGADTNPGGFAFCADIGSYAAPSATINNWRYNDPNGEGLYPFFGLVAA